MNEPNLFDMSLDELRDEAVNIVALEGSVDADIMHSRFPNEWSGLNSWAKGNIFSGDSRFINIGYKKSNKELHPEAKGRIILTWGTRI